MLLFSDPHCREDTADVVLGEVLPGIRQALRQHGERVLVCLGDWFHFRYRIDVRIQVATRDWLHSITSGPEAVDEVLILPGNHDQFDLDGRNALEVFADIPRVRVFTRPTWTKHGLWIPYRRRPEDVAQALQTPCDVNGARRVLFLHHGIRGALTNDGHQDQEGLELSSFGAWDLILCGHYHKRQQLNARTWYLGSPWQTRADEAGQAKGYAILDETGLRFFDMVWGPRFFKFEMQTPGQVLALEGITPRDDVRVHTGPEVDPGVVGRGLTALGLRNIVTPTVVTAGARLEMNEGASLEAFAQAYVSHVQTSLDRAELMRVFREVTQNGS